MQQQLKTQKSTFPIYSLRLFLSSLKELKQNQSEDRTATFVAWGRGYSPRDGFDVLKVLSLNPIRCGSYFGTKITHFFASSLN